MFISNNNFRQILNPFVADFRSVEVYICPDLFTDPTLMCFALQGLATWSRTYATAAWLGHQVGQQGFILELL